MTAIAVHQQIGKVGASCWDGASEQSLTLALMDPVTDCAEGGVIGLPASARRRTRPGRRLDLRVTARSVYRHPIAKVFAGALASRLHLSPDLHQRVHTALQEALMNALLHGNLGLDAGLRDDLRALATVDDVIRQRFMSPHIANSMIRVKGTWSKSLLQITVRDSGDGFKNHDVPSSDERPAMDRRGSGRGLTILHSLCDRIIMLRGGTIIELGFFLSAAPTDLGKSGETRPR